MWAGKCQGGEPWLAVTYSGSLAVTYSGSRGDRGGRGAARSDRHVSCLSLVGDKAENAAAGQGGRLAQWADSLLPPSLSLGDAHGVADCDTQWCQWERDTRTAQEEARDVNE